MIDLDFSQSRRGKHTWDEAGQQGLHISLDFSFLKTCLGGLGFVWHSLRTRSLCMWISWFFCGNHNTGISKQYGEVTVVSCIIKQGCNWNKPNMTIVWKNVFCYTESVSRSLLFQTVQKHVKEWKNPRSKCCSHNKCCLWAERTSNKWPSLIRNECT